AEVDEIRATIDGALTEIPLTNSQPERLVGVAGTVTRICSVVLKLKEYDASIVHGHELTRAAIDATLRLLSSVPLAERKQLPGIVPEWADVSIAGGLILERIMANFAM